MLHLPGRLGARRVGSSSHYLIRPARVTTNNARGMLAAGSCRLISSSPRHVQQAAAASVRVEEHHEGNFHLPQKVAVPGGVPYWQKLGIWKDVPEDKFLNYQWQVNHSAPTYLPLSLSNYCRSRIRSKERASYFSSYRAFSLRNCQLLAIPTHHFPKSRPEMTSSMKSRRLFVLLQWPFASHLTPSVWLTGAILLRIPFVASSSL
jgi:hypothetical protein